MTKPMPELLPCPICGGRMLFQHDCKIGKLPEVYITCNHGCCRTWNKTDIEGIHEAISSAWNRRSDLSSAREGDAIKITDNNIGYILRYGGKCRDCADEDGVCPHKGLPCENPDKGVRHVLEAVNYGLRNGFMPDMSAALRPAPIELLGQKFRIEHDGFQGTVIGSYTRLDGEEGVVMQQDGTTVVHVYRKKWLVPITSAAEGAKG